LGDLNFFLNTYSVGAVVGVTNSGGLIGKIDVPGNVSNSFWDSTTSGQITSAGNELSKTTAQMQTKLTFSSLWDWVGETTTTWVMPKDDIDAVGYPKLTSHYKCYGTNWTSSPAYGGSGTVIDPFILCSGAQVNTIVNNSLTEYDKRFFISEEIDMSGHDEQIGYLTNFGGSIDGGMRYGHTIKN
jgi:hypothetical protein